MSSPPFVTVFFNGVLVHNHKESWAPWSTGRWPTIRRTPAEEPLMLQDHHDPVRYRNIWIRRIGAYDQPEK